MVIGIDIGGTSLKYGLVNEAGEILSQESFLVDKALSQEALIDRLASNINDWLIRENVCRDNIKGVGIGCPGSINSFTGYCDYSNNLGWNNLNICKILEDKLALKCKITNDANAATLGEYMFGAGKSYKNIIMLTLGTGVGGGIIINGRLYEGNMGKGAELGHAVIRLNGRRCSCGRKGCLEAYASTTALLKTAKRYMKKANSSLLWSLTDNNPSSLNGKIFFKACRENDKAALLALDEYVSYLGEGILNYNSIFRPDAVILGGGISFQGEYLASRVRAYVEKWHYGFGPGPKVDIKTASLGNDAGIIGAAALILNQE